MNNELLRGLAAGNVQVAITMQVDVHYGNVFDYIVKRFGQILLRN